MRPFLLPWLARVDRAQNARTARSGDGRYVAGFPPQTALRQPGERKGLDLIRLDPECGRCDQPARRDSLSQGRHQRRITDATAARHNLARWRAPALDGSANATRRELRQGSLHVLRRRRRSCQSVRQPCSREQLAPGALGGRQREERLGEQPRE